MKLTAVLLCLFALWSASCLHAMETSDEDPVGHLSQLIGDGGIAVTKTGPGQRLYPLLYWLCMATRKDISPQSALFTAAQREGHPLSQARQGQLLADWRIACTYGLLTAENLPRLREGAAPVATAGRFAGRQVEVVQVRPDGPSGDLSNLALCPEASTLPPEAVAKGPSPVATQGYTGERPSLTVATPPAPTPAPGGPNEEEEPDWKRLPTLERPVTVTRVPVESDGRSPAVHVELLDVPFNGSVPLGGTRRLAVASDSGNTLSVSLIGDGPMVRRKVSHSDGGYHNVDVPKVDNTKVPKVTPVHLPGVSGNAYLIHSEAQARYYFVDVSLNSGAAFRIARVTGVP